MSNYTTPERTIATDNYHGYRIPMPSKWVFEIAASHKRRMEALASIGIEPESPDDERAPLALWRDAIADESGIPREQLNPAKGGALDLSFAPGDVRKFAWFLA